MRVADENYIKAVELFGLSGRAIVRQEILPNLASPLMVELSLRFTYSLLATAALSFLGFGFQPPAPSWGTMINENRLGLSLNSWAALAPAAILAILTIGVSLVTEAIAKAALVGGDSGDRALRVSSFTP
jgi:peptide/nickel transport system permease protein